MNNHYRLEVEDSALDTITAFLRGLLEKGIVDALLVPRHTPSGDNVVQMLITDPTRLEDVDPIAPVLPVNSAKLVSDLTATGAVGRLGAVLRSCEVRALIELVKLKQASLDNVVLIGVDCLGTYEMNDYAELAATSNGDLSTDLLAQAKEGHFAPHEGHQFRVACQMCEYPVPQGVDLALGLIGVDTANEILVTTSDELAEKLKLSRERAVAGFPPKVGGDRGGAVDGLVAERTAERDRQFAEFRQRVTDMPSLLAEFSRCIRCHNCMVACPLCYCKECIFRTATFDHASAQYFRWATRKGSIRMPTDTLIFQLTRLNHMATSCVGCGMCESACPNDLPVATIFRAVGEKVQALFDYVPGRSLEEELPVATFREDELTSLGERE
ncbi:MAG: 4Fe-4S dicluster domain-containing protein [Anaerolineae bacterium]